MLLAVLLGLTAPCWPPPVDAPIRDPYRAPACTYCPGNRGIEYAPSPGQPVVAVAAGVVTFAATVARTRYVVIEHADGIRATYGQLTSTTVVRGDRVRTGQRIGTAGDGLYFGLRQADPDDRPIDPTPMLGSRRWPTRLVPVDGTPPRPAGPGRLQCRNQGRRR